MSFPRSRTISATPQRNTYPSWVILKKISKTRDFLKWRILISYLYLSLEKICHIDLQKTGQQVAGRLHNLIANVIVIQDNFSVFSDDTVRVDRRHINSDQLSDLHQLCVHYPLLYRSYCHEVHQTRPSQTYQGIIMISNLSQSPDNFIYFFANICIFTMQYILRILYLINVHVV